MTDRVAYRIERLPTERWLKVVLGTFLMLAASLWLIGRPAAAASSGIDATARNSELHCLALTIYFEARGESKAGKSAVGHVVMNRVLDRRFPSDACQVVRQGGEWPRYRCQFSWWCDGRSDRPRDKRAWLESIQVASDVLAGRSIDPTRARSGIMPTMLARCGARPTSADPASAATSSIKSRRRPWPLPSTRAPGWPAR